MKYIWLYVIICLQNIWSMRIEKKQIDINYEVLLATLNNKTLNNNK